MFRLNRDIHEYRSRLWGDDHDILSPFQIHHVVHLSELRDGILSRHVFEFKQKLYKGSAIANTKKLVTWYI